MEKRQLAVVKSMPLNLTAPDPLTINGAAKSKAQARTTLKDVGVAGLIAQPLN